MTTAVPLDTQVGGHDGVLSSADGSVIIKPCLPLEIDFYTALSSNPAFAHLLQHVPKFYGTLKLHGRLDEHGNSLVLENLTHTFTKPNVLDIKLGTVLADEFASPEKRARMEKRARETTSLETGVRLTGFNVYDHTEGRFVKTPKAYGRAITKAELPSGIAKYFPLATSDDVPVATPGGSFPLTTTDVPAPSDGSFPSSTSEVPRGQGLPRELLHQVITGLISEIERIRAAVSHTQMRMVGCSLLVIYEADWEELRVKLKGRECGEQGREAKEDGGGGGVDMGGEDGEEDVEGEEGDDEDEDAEGEDTEDEEDADSDSHFGPPYLAKLIDFGHTLLVEREEGGGDVADTGVIIGLDTTVGLFSGRLEEVARGADGGGGWSGEAERAETVHSRTEP